jgi:hypothetical protein
VTTANITQERAATRFHHLATLERQLAAVQTEVVNCKEHLKELRRLEAGLIDRMCRAARDEGELPLFDLLEDGQ